MQQAEWNDIIWGSSNTNLALIKNFEISQEVDIQEEKSDKGENKRIIKGLKPEVLTVSYPTGFVAGTDTRGEFDMLKKCAGMQADFILNGNKLGVEPFELDELNLNNTKIDNYGRMHCGDITLNFNTEKNPSSKGGKKKGSSGKVNKGKKGSSLSLKKDILNS